VPEPISPRNRDKFGAALDRLLHRAAVAGKELNIGRNAPPSEEKLTLSVFFPEMSREHLELFWRGGALWARDLGATNKAMIISESGETSPIEGEVKLTPGSRLVFLVPGDPPLSYTLRSGAYFGI
jgi:hypothetical protein